MCKRINCRLCFTLEVVWSTKYEVIFTLMSLSFSFITVMSKTVTVIRWILQNSLSNANNLLPSEMIKLES